MHHYDVDWSCKLAWLWDRELLRAVVCSTISAQLSDYRRAQLHARAKLFDEQRQLAEQLVKRPALSVPEPIPISVVVRTQGDDGKPICSFDNEAVEKRRYEMVEEVHVSASAGGCTATGGEPSVKVPVSHRPNRQPSHWLVAVQALAGNGWKKKSLSSGWHLMRYYRHVFEVKR